MSATTSSRSGTDTAREVADAVLYEGYVLYPYRASAMKNSYRWQWGVVVPGAHAEAVAADGGAIPSGERGELGFDVPLQATPDTRVSVTARFLQLCHRQVHDPDGAPVDRWEVPSDDELLLTWDEGHEREVRTPPIPVFKLLDVAFVQSARMDAHVAEEVHADGSRTERRFAEVVAEVEMSAEEVGHDVVRLRVAVRNVTPWAERGADRDTALRRSMVGTHLLASVLGGEFGSVIDRPAWAQDVVCDSDGLYPVLAGDDGGTDVVLAAPIILEDHPEVAEESPGPSFDALEIDELMALAVKGMTDEEKREARATDPRAAEVVDAFGDLPPAVMDRLHGTIREFGPGAEAIGLRSTAGLQPEPEADVDQATVDFFGVGEEPLDEAVVGDATIRVGDEVVLSPRRRADVHDMIADGRRAEVHRMVRTVDGDTMVAVTLVEDPAAELHRWYGRFQYFHLDEVVPAGSDEPAGTDRPTGQGDDDE